MRPETTGMGVTHAGLLLDAVSSVKQFVHVFVLVYIFLILVYIITTWIRLPYSPWLSRVQRFLYDVCDPYLRQWRKILPMAGPFDFSPIVGVFALIAVERIVVAILDRLH